MNNRDRCESGVCIYVVVVVLIEGELRGGIDLTVLQDIECAHGQHMGMLLRSAAKRALRF